MWNTDQLKQLKKIHHIFFTLLVSLLIFSCTEKYEGQSEGEIHFKVTYPLMDKDNFMLDMLPKKMITKFKEDKMSNTLSAGMGMFKFGIMSDFEHQSIIRTAKLINKKYALTLNNDAVFEAFKKEPTYNIQFSNDTKTILGYECKKLIITVKDETNHNFFAYYTDKININHPNWFNQYAKIKGVLLEYEYEKYGVRMRMKATKIHFKQLEDEDFTIPESYEAVSLEKMDKEMSELFGSFQ